MTQDAAPLLHETAPIDAKRKTDAVGEDDPQFRNNPNSKNEGLKKESEAGYRWILSTRFAVAFLLSGGYMCIETVQASIGMAIVCMVNVTFLINHSNFTSLECPATGETAGETIDYGGELPWGDVEQGLVLSAFQWGVLIAPFTGWLCDKFSPKWLLAFSVFLTALAGTAIPLLASTSYLFAVTGRALMGVGEAILIPAINCLLAAWYPQNERNSAISIAIGGRQIGTLMILPLSGFFCARKDILGGWPAIFFVAAMFGGTWAIFWVIFGSNDPASFKWCMADKEREYLSSKLKKEKGEPKRKSKLVPWKKLLRSKSVWASSIAVICQEFPQITLSLFLPSYLHDVFFYSSTSNGLLSALPPLFLWCNRIATASIADFLQKRFHISKTILAKVFNSLGAFGVGAFLIATTFLSCANSNIAVAFLCLSLAFSGFHSAGCLGTLVSVAPAFSGSITGLTYFIIALSGILNPLMTTTIVTSGSKSEWNFVFLVNAAVSFLPLIVFNVWGSAKEEPWAWHKEDPNMQMENEVKKDSTVL